MIELVFGGIAYGATLIGCYDGDTCKFRIDGAPALVDTVHVRLAGMDTPEIRGKCQEEKDLALVARDYTLDYLRNFNGYGIVHDLRDKYGRMVVEFPDLVSGLISNDLARPYDGKTKRQGWCGKDLDNEASI